MSIKNPTIPGEVLAGIDRKINELEVLLEHLDKKEVKPRHMYEGSIPSALWSSFKEQTIARLQDLRDKKGRHLKENPPPTIEALKCPHCGYDGEFDAEDGEVKGIGFRILQPILEPRWVFDYDGETLSLSDPCDRYDPFDMIAEPGYVDCLDSEEKVHSDPEEQRLRNMLRGRWVFCCGNESCLKYFDARPFIERAHVDYPINHLNQNKWGRR